MERQDGDAYLLSGRTRQVAKVADQCVMIRHFEGRVNCMVSVKLLRIAKRKKNSVLSLLKVVCSLHQAAQGDECRRYLRYLP
jgi:hypothetical protein